MMKLWKFMKNKSYARRTWIKPSIKMGTEILWKYQIWFMEQLGKRKYYKFCFEKSIKTGLITDLK